MLTIDNKRQTPQRDRLRMMTLFGVTDGPGDLISACATMAIPLMPAVYI